MKKIVVVDDDPMILMMMKDMFRSSNIEVITQKESMKALEVIRKEKPSLVILDLMMPELSGIDLCRIIKKDPETCDIPIFILTGKGQGSDEQEGLQCGASRYITKPFSPKSIIQMVKEVLGAD